MGELLIPNAYHHIGPAGHAGMHGTVPQKQTKSRVMGIGRHAPDSVTRINILQVYFHSLLAEVILNMIAEENADIAGPNIPWGVLFEGSFH